MKISKEVKKKPAKNSGIFFNSWKANFLTVLITVVGTFLLTYITSNLSNWFPGIFPVPASYPFWDAFTTVMSFVATVLLAKKVVENWYIWILVDIIGIVLYYLKGVKFISLEYVIFLGMASYGLYDWLRTLKKEGRIKLIWLPV